MNFLDKRRYSLDIGVLLAHAPLRVYAMGQRAVVHERATEADIKVMTAALRSAMAAGAFGYSSGRIEEHIYGEDFAPAPGAYDEHEEIMAPTFRPAATSNA
jgi:N-acyl-D-amino-acid deacylase